MLSSIKTRTQKCLVIFSLIFLVLTVNAQAVPPQLAGIWQTSISLGEGLPVAAGLFKVQSNGSYREEMIVEGQLGAFWEGTYSLSPDGTLTQNVVSKSPQVCVQGNCVANEGEPVTVSSLSFQSPDSLKLSLLDGSLVLEYQRVSESLPNPTPAIPATPEPIVTPNPITPTPTNPNLPVAPVNPWFGTYSNGDLTLVIAGPGKDFIERAGTRYPLQLQGTLERLEGSFSNNGTNYPVVLERNGQRISLTSGELRFELEPVIEQPSNPLN
jgi:hypothetical protein